MLRSRFAEVVPHLLAGLLGCCWLAATAPSQAASALTLQIGSPPAPPTVLASHTNFWFWRRGTSEPPADWRISADAALDAAWQLSRGGFGYGDSGIAGETTTISGMTGVHSTLYVRQSFTVGELADANAHLRLRVDYDDGFVAYLDGVEVARRMFLTNSPGTFVPRTATTTNSHEASCCNAPTNPAETIDLGIVGTRLAPGTHVLAIIGINGTLGSSDFHLIADLILDGGASAVLNGELFSLVTTNTVTLSGTNTVPGSTRVAVNGDEVVFDPVQGTWTHALTLAPGLNRLFIAALDASGVILASTNRDIVCESATTTTGGLLTGNTSWTAAQGVVRVTNTLTVADGVTLSIGEGVVVLLAPSAGIQAKTNGTVDVAGSDERPVCFFPSDGTTPWQSLWADGTNAVLTLRHAEVAGGQVVAATNSVVTVEDTLVRDFHVSGRNMVQGLNARQLTLRRAHLRRYEQCRFAQTPLLIEDSLFEEIGSDTTDFSNQSDIVVRRSTYRFGHGSNTDALDLGGSTNFLAEDCLIHDFPDKGVSVADNSHGAVIRNCLIYNVGIGIATYASSDVVYSQNTIANSTSGVSLYLRPGFPGAGHAVGTNNIIWGNVTNVHLADGATLDVSYSDIEGASVFPGAGNANADPLFVNAAAGDYRLRAGSPALGTGLAGANMGVALPVGGLPAAPLRLAALTAGTNAIQLTWRDDSENETVFLVERSTDARAWQPLGVAVANATNFTDGTTDLEQLYYYRARAMNDSGLSPWSNLASARRSPPRLVVGGVLTSNTVWSPALGTIIVGSTLTVPTNLTLTIEPGTVVNISNGVSIRAVAGGTIDIEGAYTNKVVLRSLDGTNHWGQLSASGPNASLLIRHADISHGSVKSFTNAIALIEDSHVHHYAAGTDPMIGSTRASSVTLRRSRFDHYHETLFQFTLMLVEDCLFEDANNANSDCMDFDAAPAGSIVRRCTYRNGPQSNTDAIDIGFGDGQPSVETLIIDCLMQDLTDKGVSIGEGARGVVVSNCLMIATDRGVQVKDTSTATIANCTIVNSGIGIHCYQKVPGPGGSATNTYNNILWNNGSAITIETNSIISVNYTDAQGTNWPGLGNLDADPLFVNAAQDDYRLSPGSPCLGTGQGGMNMGVYLPVGAHIHAPSNLVAVAGRNFISLSWHDSGPSEAAYEVERSTNGSAFTRLVTVPADTTNYVDANLAAGLVCRYRVRGVNIITNSDYSSEAAATVGLPPSFTTQPESRVVRPGSDVAFSVAASGLEPLTFVWQHDGIVLTGEANTALSRTNVQAADAGDYVAVVTDAAGLSATSVVARLTVTASPQITLGAGSSGVNSNGQFVLQFAAPTNLTVVIEASTNLLDWQPVRTNSTGDGVFQFIDLGSTNFLERFYRALLRP
ncbi:MAG: right-handed parallel beta-helix repeat-containing protein [Verrucomicrobia bacterium]|nr:right-handed parallel beta-helix repeat-containing protein [Verrucomicrobiota bacterium]